MTEEIKLDYEKFKVGNKKEYYGGNQEWYKKYFQRLAGCGPTTASAIIMYEKRKVKELKNTKSEFLNLMEEVWNYITPGNMGVNKVEYFKNGFDKYLKDNNLTFESSILEIPKSKNKRPTNIELFDYLKSSITSDHPIAFLNLDHGKEKRLESWHWVLIIGITYDKEESIINANIADQGEIKTINLTLWLETTLLGGGFIYYK